MVAPSQTLLVAGAIFSQISAHHVWRASHTCRHSVSPQDLLDSSTNKHIQVNDFHPLTSQRLLIKAGGEMK